MKNASKKKVAVFLKFNSNNLLESEFIKLFAKLKY